VAANYRAACRSKSKKDFVYKLQVVEEECDETIFFLELIQELSSKESSTLRIRASQILAIIITSIRTTRARYLQKT
ncbi:MAG: four helix bundle protein, partial [Bacteroidetes bacterium]|nr:four helix bundle protein [Bacteroidota bacterium]